MRVIGYVRVSTEGQATSGVSLPAQKAAIACEVARREGWRLVDYASDTASGKSVRRRPGLEQAMRRLDAGELDVLVVARMDRLSRSVGDFAGILDRADRRGWLVVCLDPAVDMSTPYGRAMAGMSAVWAQLERELIGQRTREGIAAARERGSWRPSPVLASSVAVGRIVELAGQDLSSRRIAERLNLEGVPGPTGGGWGHSSVLRVLERERRATTSA